MSYEITDVKLVVRTSTILNTDKESTETRVSYLLALVDFNYCNQKYTEVVKISDVCTVNLILGYANKVTKNDLSSIDKEFIDKEINTALENRIKIINCENQEKLILDTVKNCDFGYRFDI